MVAPRTDLKMPENIDLNEGYEPLRMGVMAKFLFLRAILGMFILVGLVIMVLFVVGVGAYFIGTIGNYGWEFARRISGG